MIEPNIQNSLIRFLTKSANKTDLDALNVWIEKAQNKQRFKDFVKTHYAITVGMNDPNPDELKKRLIQEIRRDKKMLRINNYRKVLRYAAIGLVLLGLGYFYRQEIWPNGEPSTSIAIESNQVTLELYDGEIIALPEDRTGTVIDSDGNIIGFQKGDKLMHDFGFSNTSSHQNLLNVPYGKRFELLLSDGTALFVNAGSSVRYPPRFVKEKKREVSLVGEAFFDVNHMPNQPFNVKVQNLNVMVLGTEFNVSNYPEDTATDVVLVEGSVLLDPNSSLGKGAKDLILRPGYKGAYDKAKGTISEQEVDTHPYISWKSGNLIFRNEFFDEISKKLERTYDITIVNHNTKLTKERFSATIETDRESIADILEYFDKIYGIDYKIDGDKITIE